MRPVVLRRAFLTDLASGRCVHCGRHGPAAREFLEHRAPARPSWLPLFLAALPWTLGLALWRVLLSVPVPRECSWSLRCPLLEVSPGVFTVASAAAAGVGVLFYFLAQHAVAARARLGVSLCFRCRDFLRLEQRRTQRCRALGVAVVLVLGALLPRALAALTGAVALTQGTAPAAWMAASLALLVLLCAAWMRAAWRGRHPRLRCARVTPYSVTLHVPLSWDQVLREELPHVLHPDHHPGARGTATRSVPPGRGSC